VGRVLEEERGRVRVRRVGRRCGGGVEGGCVTFWIGLVCLGVPSAEEVEERLSRLEEAPESGWAGVLGATGEASALLHLGRVEECEAAGGAVHGDDEPLPEAGPVEGVLAGKDLRPLTRNRVPANGAVLISLSPPWTQVGVSGRRRESQFKRRPTLSSPSQT
jgi:hypothetical protein